MEKNTNFQRDDNGVMGRAIQGTMIMVAEEGNRVCDDLVCKVYTTDKNLHEANALMYGLSKTAAMLIKALVEIGLPADKMFEGMLNVWLNDVDFNNDFTSWAKHLEASLKGVE